MVLTPVFTTMASLLTISGRLPTFLHSRLEADREFALLDQRRQSALISRADFLK